MEQYLTGNQWVLWLILAWTLPWKGVALWKAASNKHLKWFIAILVLNTLALVEIVYIFFFSKPRNTTSSAPQTKNAEAP